MELHDKIEIVRGDITTVTCDVLVNAANSSLLGGGGVDGAIHRVGGEAILKECKEIVEKQGGCETGKAVITTAGNLPAKFVIHTVGPIWRGGHKDEGKLLADCYKNSLQLAIDHGCKTIAFPNISTGIYGYPKEMAATIATGTVINFLMGANHPLKVFFVCFEEDNYNFTKRSCSW